MKLDFNLKNATFQEVITQVNGQYTFLDELEDLKDKVAPTTFDRLKRWQHYFNRNYIKAACIYSDLNFALIEASKRNPIYKSQTTHEFELSLGFFDRLFESGVFLKTNDLPSAKMLLNISLIFSKYPGLVVGSFNKAFYELRNGVNEISLQGTFEMLFVKFESPSIFIKHINFLNLEDIQALMHVLMGNNIRTFNYLPLSVSKKESYIFMNELPDDLTFTDSILLRSLVCSKLLIGGKGDPNMLSDFLNSSKVFELKLEAFIEDLNFWRQAFNIVSKKNQAAGYLSIQEYVDYFEYKKYNENPNYSLKGRTPNSIANVINYWHETAEFAKNKALLNLKWKRRTESDVTITKGKTTYLFKELTSGVELLRESESLKHCVFSYAEYCAKGSRSIWSLQKKCRQGFQHYITIEVWNNAIVQASGKYNRWLIKEETDLIDEWAEKMEFKNQCVVF